MIVQIFSSMNQKPLGKLTLEERPRQGEYVSVSGVIYRIDKVIHQQNANNPIILHVCP